MKIKIDARGKKFNFSVDGKELDNSISKVVAATAKSGKDNIKGFLIVSYEEKLYVVGYNPDTYVVVLQRSGIVEGSGCFAFNYTHLHGLVKNRGDLNFSFDGKSVAFKAVKGRYNGSIHSEQLTDEQAIVINAELNGREDGKIDAVLPKDVLSLLKEGVNLTAIKDVFTDQALLSYMTLSAKGTLTVSSFDKHHFGLYTTKVKSNGLEFRVALPSSHFNMIDRMADSDNVKFYVRAESLKVQGDSFVMILPATQTDERNYTNVQSYLKEVTEPTFTCVMDVQKFSNVLNNLFTLSVEKAAAILDLSNKEGSAMVNMKFSTSSGNAEDAVKASKIDSKGMKAQVDPRLLKDCLSLVRSQNDMTLSVIPKRIFMMACETGSGSIKLAGALAS